MIDPVTIGKYALTLLSSGFVVAGIKQLPRLKKAYDEWQEHQWRDKQWREDINEHKTECDTRHGALLDRHGRLENRVSHLEGQMEGDHQVHGT